jgi:hypothetical protein
LYWKCGGLDARSNRHDDGHSAGRLTLVADHGELTGIYFPYQRSRPDLATFGERSDPGFEEITHQLAAVETSRSVTTATLPSPAVVTEPVHG